MEELDQDIVYRMVVSTIRAHTYRVKINGFDIDDTKKRMNINYVYAFPIDNETEDRTKFNNSTQHFHYFMEDKGYLYTLSKYNSNISEDYTSYNMNTTLVFCPEWIDFNCSSMRTKIKLSHDISYSKVYYGKHIGNITNMIESTIGIEKDDDIIKALKNDFEI